MPSYGPMILTEFGREPEPCSTVVAADGSGTYRRDLMSNWLRPGRQEMISWERVMARLFLVPCWILTPEIVEGTCDDRT